MLKCKDCGTTDPRAFYMLMDHDDVVDVAPGVEISCDDCACDRWEAQRPEREQRERERLDAEGYYDDPVGWQHRKDVERRAKREANR